MKQGISIFMIFLLSLLGNAQSDTIRTSRWQTGIDVSNSFLHLREYFIEDLGQRLSVFEMFHINKRNAIGVGLNMWVKFSNKFQHDKRINFYTYSVQLNYIHQVGKRWDFTINPFFPILSYHPVKLSNKYGPFWPLDESSLAESSMRDRIWGIVPFSFEYHRKLNSPLRWNFGISLLGYSFSKYGSPQFKLHCLASLQVGMGYRF